MRHEECWHSLLVNFLPTPTEPSVSSQTFESKTLQNGSCTVGRPELCNQWDRLWLSWISQLTHASIVQRAGESIEYGLFEVVAAAIQPNQSVDNKALAENTKARVEEFLGGMYGIQQLEQFKELEWKAYERRIQEHEKLVRDKKRLQDMRKLKEVLEENTGLVRLRRNAKVRPLRHRLHGEGTREVVIRCLWTTWKRFTTRKVCKRPWCQAGEVEVSRAKARAVTETPFVVAANNKSRKCCSQNEHQWKKSKLWTNLTEIWSMPFELSENRNEPEDSGTTRARLPFSSFNAQLPPQRQNYVTL